ncbi:MAG: sodium/glutamate symporter [Deltaproteobacteria bacterium]|jgi:ESS family glutamate:Na+ symporter|nr:sodium/glutamate symporter [Deltaproteobacteria bacterium]MBW2496178.1 sodium/glutamate symporter [Deltaproteobacteria bacterium]
MSDEVQIQHVAAMDMLALSIAVIFLGLFLNRRIAFLRENYIPPAVTGGLIFSLFTSLVFFGIDIELEFDMRFRDVLLLVFFSTVGLSARLNTLAAGGRALFVLTAAAGVFLVLQNAVGVGLAMLTGAHPVYGLMAGSVSFAGGHGTAIAWGTAAEAAGFARAGEVGLAFATFGLVCGGLVGGPIARRLMARDDLAAPGETLESVSGKPDETVHEGQDALDWLYPVLTTLLVLALCVSLGDLVNRYLSSRDIRMPGFLTSMFVGILITNLADAVRIPLSRETIDRFGEVSLHIFLAMSMMTIELWALAGSASVILLVIASQIVLMTIFAIFVVYRLMGRDYDAVVISAGFAGMGLGATPVAIANMDAITMRYGPSTKAFLVLPLVGAFFIDLLNAGTINFFIRMIRQYLV